MNKLLVGAMALAVGLAYASGHVAFSAEDPASEHRGQGQMAPESSSMTETNPKSSPEQAKKSKKSKKAAKQKKARKSTQPVN